MSRKKPVRRKELGTAEAQALFPRRVLRTPAAAVYVGLGIPTLEKLRLTGGGPAFVRLGVRAVGYDVEDLDRWIEQRKRTSTSNGDGAEDTPKGARIIRRPVPLT
jgi:predicted DNA-binding transcriptional regulator AlpA